MGRKYTPAQAKACQEYLKKFEQIPLRVTPEQKTRYQAKAKEKGLSLNKFITQTLDEVL